MITPVTRYLVDKKYVFKDGKEFYQLYFYDAMDGVIVTILAPIFNKQLNPDSQSYNESAIAELSKRTKRLDIDNKIVGE